MRGQWPYERIIYRSGVYPRRGGALVLGNWLAMNIYAACFLSFVAGLVMSRIKVRRDDPSVTQLMARLIPPSKAAGKQTSWKLLK